MRLPEIHRYGQVFNFVADNIQCWADAEGAQVFECLVTSDQMPDFYVRVLAYTELGAREVAWAYEESLCS